MKMKVTTNASEVLADIDAFAKELRDVAVPRVLNRLADQAQTVGLREVAAIYKIGPRTFEKYLSRRMAQTGEVVASITARGMGLPLFLFSPRRTPKGVSVSIKGRRYLIPHAFIARMSSGKVGVFARGAYGGKGVKTRAGQSGRFVFGKERLPINELFTFGPAEAWRAETVTTRMLDRVQEQMGKEMKREIRFLLRRA